ncbi:ATP-binding protein [Pantoea sp. A4]|uniref:ATP-binding protein n=1 Tax=Pantoea sp. A4 TaxID=1225184 RepID=UPI000367DF24|nr:ATP-binding protein [Pantoea sp. A4]
MEEKAAVSSIVKHQTPVHLQGLMQVFSQHLYSTPIVAIRELVQNAHDAILRRRLEQPDWQQAGRIEVRCRPEIPSISVTDNGSGLTESEIHRFLATVGLSYTRQLRQDEEQNGLIGMFGLGFASSFVLSQQVTVNTTSWQEPAASWCYNSSDGETYTVEATRSQPVGSTVELILKPEVAHLASHRHLSAVLGRYCALLKEPVYVGDDEQAINHIQPPWRENASSSIALHPALIQKQQLAFAQRFETRFTPLCVLPVVPDGGSDVRGILWLQDGATYGTSDNRNVSLFLRGMLIDDQARELLPPWAGFVGGVLESSALIPTASREDLQRDASYEATQLAINEALISGLGLLAQKQPEIWRRVLARHNEALMGAALCDERLFALLQNELLIPTTQGNMPARDLRRDNTITMMLGEDSGFEGMLFRLQQKPVALGDRYAVVPFLRRWAQSHAARLIELGTRAGNEQLFSVQELPEAEEQWWQQQLAQPDEAFVVARFEPDVLPLMLVKDREAELKKRLEEDDADKRMSTAALMLAKQFTQKVTQTQSKILYLNSANPAINAIIQCRKAGQQPSTETLVLLKSLKALLAAQSTDAEEGALTQALHSLGQIIINQTNTLMTR